MAIDEAVLDSLPAESLEVIGPKVRDGDIVVALVEGSEATLKRFYQQQDGRVRLQPANASMAPILVNPADLEIQGRVLAVMRKY